MYIHVVGRRHGQRAVAEIDTDIHSTSLVLVHPSARVSQSLNYHTAMQSAPRVFSIHLTLSPFTIEFEIEKKSSQHYKIALT